MHAQFASDQIFSITTVDVSTNWGGGGGKSPPSMLGRIVHMIHPSCLWCAAGWKIFRFQIFWNDCNPKFGIPEAPKGMDCGKCCHSYVVLYTMQSRSPAINNLLVSSSLSHLFPNLLIGSYEDLKGMRMFEDGGNAALPLSPLQKLTGCLCLPYWNSLCILKKSEWLFLSF